jgi:hypothetical protein
MSQEVFEESSAYRIRALRVLIQNHEDRRNEDRHNGEKFNESTYGEAKPAAGFRNNCFGASGERSVRELGRGRY